MQSKVSVSAAQMIQAHSFIHPLQTQRCLESLAALQLFYS